MSGNNLPDSVTDKDIEQAFGGEEPREPFGIELQSGTDWDYLGEAQDWSELIYIVGWLREHHNNVRVKDEKGEQVDV